MQRNKAAESLKKILENIEHEECAWCGANEPYDGMHWTVVDYEDADIGDDPYRYCSPLHTSFAMTAIVDEVNSPDETQRDLETLQSVLDHFRGDNG